MNFKALDDPALLLPRVMDVTGAFKRMGFVWGYNRCHDAGQCTRNIQLFHPVESERQRRPISHAHFLIIWRADTLDVNVGYGYPTRRRNSRKIVAGFKELADGDHRDFSVSDDIALRHVEKTLKELIHHLEHHALDLRGLDDDGNSHDLNGWEALSCAVQSGLSCKPSTIKKHSKWFEIESWWLEEPKEARVRPPRVVHRQGRLPNHGSRKQLLKFVRRPQH